MMNIDGSVKCKEGIISSSVCANFDASMHDASPFQHHSERIPD